MLQSVTVSPAGCATLANDCWSRRIFCTLMALIHRHLRLTLTGVTRTSAEISGPGKTSVTVRAAC